MYKKRTEKAIEYIYHIEREHYLNYNLLEKLFLKVKQLETQISHAYSSELEPERFKHRKRLEIEDTEREIDGFTIELREGYNRLQERIKEIKLLIKDEWAIALKIKIPEKWE